MTGFVLILLFIKSTVYCPAHYFIAHFIFYFFYFLHTYIYVCSLVFVFDIIALSYPNKQYITESLFIQLSDDV